MRKRLRKKRHVRDFREFGFYVAVRAPAGLPASDLDRFWDEFISGAIRRNGLTFAGGWGRELGFGFVACGRGRSRSDRSRQSVRSYLAALETVDDYELGPLVDSWYGGDPGPEFERYQERVSAFQVSFPAKQSTFSKTQVAAVAFSLPKQQSESFRELIQRQG